MGIPGFTKRIIDNFQKQILKIIPDLINNQNVLYLDFNCVIHNATQGLIDEYKRNGKKLTNEIMFRDIVKFTNQLLDYVNPNKCYLIIDGQCPKSKMIQQRLRRFKTKPNNVFDKNAISPGTQFMKELSSYLNNWSKESKYEIIISDDLEPGEAEQKMFKIIKNDTIDNNHIIYSLDADLIMLSLIVDKKIYIMREKQNYEEKLYNYEENKINFHYLDIQVLKNKIYQEFQNNEDRKYQSINNISENECMDDIIFLYFFLGNDFCPHVKLFNIYKNGMELLTDSYLYILNKYKKPLVNGLDINPDFLTDIMYKCISNENYIIKKNSNKLDINKIGYGNKMWKKNHNFYYFKSNDKQTRYEVSDNYMKILKWTLEYYKTNDVPSWRYNYKYSYGPVITDFIEYLEYNNDEINEIKFEKDEKYTFEQQLVMILPYHSKHLLKKENQKYIDDELEEYYPISFRLDKINKTHNWQHEPILPEIDDNMIMKYIN